MRQRRIESFLVRVVVEDQGDTKAFAWRGRVQHVGSGVEQAFESQEELLNLLRSQVVIDFSAIPQGEHFSSEDSSQL